MKTKTILLSEEILSTLEFVQNEEKIEECPQLENFFLSVLRLTLPTYTNRDESA
jgi:hypothetical protein